MEQQLRRYFAGIVGFAFVVVWATLGATDAVAAVVACVGALSLERLLPSARSLPSRRRPSRPPRRSTISARPLREEDGGHRDDAYQLVPDEPSLILST